jgi:hypothetical protein
MQGRRDATHKSNTAYDDDNYTVRPGSSFFHLMIKALLKGLLKNEVDSTSLQRQFATRIMVSGIVCDWIHGIRHDIKV